MRWVLSVVLVVVWLLGMFTGYTFGGLVHMLLLFAFLLAMVGGTRARTWV